MSNKIKEIVEEMYMEWLQENCPEDFHSSDELIELFERGHEWDRFVTDHKLLLDEW